VVAAQDDREDPLADDPRDCAVDLVEALLDVGRDDEDVPRSTRSSSSSRSTAMSTEYES